MTAGEKRGKKSAETDTQKARRFRHGLKVMAGWPDHENWWTIARTAMHYMVEDGDTIEKAKAKAIADVDGGPDDYVMCQRTR